jgi:hypothetical protein
MTLEFGGEEIDLLFLITDKLLEAKSRVIFQYVE